MKWLLIYFAAISIFAVIITVYDKVRAVRHKWRVKESTLLIVAFLGGGAAMLLTMLIIRHKTRHKKFMIGIPVIILLHICAAYVFWRVFYG